VNTAFITEMATGHPGATGQVPNSSAPPAETLRLNGCSTAAFGQWHETAARGDQRVRPLRPLAAAAWLRRVWQFAPRITLPIFDGGFNQANLEASQATRDIAVAQYERSIQAAFREVADALAGRATLGEQLRAQRAQAKAEETRYRLADLRCQNGASSYLDVLDVQRALFLVQQTVVAAQAAQVQNLVTFYKVLGGGWKDAPN
jgi:outer membrane protein TolC